jgi:hypothetical protein
LILETWVSLTILNNFVFSGCQFSSLKNQPGASKIASFFGFLKVRPFFGKYTLNKCAKLSTSEHAK